MRDLNLSVPELVALAGIAAKKDAREAKASLEPGSHSGAFTISVSYQIEKAPEGSVRVKNPEVDLALLLAAALEGRRRETLDRIIARATSADFQQRFRRSGGAAAIHEWMAELLKVDPIISKPRAGAAKTRLEIERVFEAPRLASVGTY